jgi:hypothetical protein
VARFGTGSWLAFGRAVCRGLRRRSEGHLLRRSGHARLTKMIVSTPEVITPGARSHRRPRKQRHRGRRLELGCSSMSARRRHRPWTTGHRRSHESRGSPCWRRPSPCRNYARDSGHPRPQPLTTPGVAAARHAPTVACAHGGPRRGHG